MIIKEYKGTVNYISSVSRVEDVSQRVHTKRQFWKRHTFLWIIPWRARRDSSVSVVTKVLTGLRGTVVLFPSEKRDLCVLSKESIQILGAKQPQLKKVLSLLVKPPGREANRRPSSGAKVKNDWSCHKHRQCQTQLWMFYC